MLKTWQSIVKNKMQLIGETQESLAEKLHVSQGSIAHWLSGRRKPDTDTISRLMRAIGLKQIVLNCDGSATEYNDLTIRHSLESYIEIKPLYIDFKQFINSEIQQILQMISFKENYLEDNFNGFTIENLRIITMKGDSMETTLLNGDTIFIDVSKNTFEGNGIYLFDYNDNLLIKRLQFINNNIHVLSDNKSYLNWEIPFSERDKLHIHGKVVVSQSMRLTKYD